MTRILSVGAALVGAVLLLYGTGKFAKAAAPPEAGSPAQVVRSEADRVVVDEDALSQRGALAYILVGAGLVAGGAVGLTRGRPRRGAR